MKLQVVIFDYAVYTPSNVFRTYTYVITFVSFMDIKMKSFEFVLPYR